MSPLVSSLWEILVVDDTPPPQPCPRCGGVCGDGDRVYHGMCGRCVHFARQRR